MQNREDITALPFYAGQKVILCPNLSDKNRGFKHGIIYTVSECISKMNPANGRGPFVYVGIVGYRGGASWFSPRLFMPIEEIEASIMSFKEIKQTEPMEILFNN